MAGEIPIACTLSPSDYQTRLKEIASLSREALRRVDRQGDVLDLRYAPAAADRVRALVDQERTCCPFLTFEIHEHATEVQLLVTVPAAALDAVPELLRELTGAEP